MTTVVLLHSALGLTAHVHAWADALREDGHVVETPDMFGGETFHDLDSAVTFVDAEGGPPAFVRSVVAQIRDVDGPVVYAGFSLGAGVAQLLTMQRADAAGTLLISGLVGPGWLDHPSWPAGVPGQLHYTQGDAWVEPDEVRALLDLAGGAIEEIVYPGDGHLFAFEGWHEYDSEASHRLYEHVTDFLAALDA